MGKERIIEMGRQGLRSIGEFAKTKPEPALLGIAGMGLSSSGLVLSAVDVNETMIIINLSAHAINAGVVISALKLKNSKSIRQQSHPQNSPEL